MISQLANSTRVFRAWTISLSLFGLAACSERSAKRPSVDSDLARDLALAGTGTEAAQPTFQDTSVAPAPATRARDQLPAPARTHAARATRPKVEPPQPVQTQPAQQPTPAPATQAAAPMSGPAPAHAEIGSGTGVALTSGSKVCTSSLPGDKMVATVNTAVTGSNGAVIPAGSSVVLEVASVNAGQNGDAPQITFRVRAIVVNDKTYTAAADVASLTPLEKTKVASADNKKVIGGALAGALIGQIIGHNTKGTLIGAAAGAATGAAIAKSGEKWEGCLPAGAALQLTFNSPLVMS